MGVLALWRCPIKAMLGELVQAVQVGRAGLAGDRHWVVADARTGARIASKRGLTDPALRACRAELVDDPTAASPLRVTLPGDETLEGEDVERGLSSLLGRHVLLERHTGPALGRLFATCAHHDCAPVHLVTTRTLAHLRALSPRSDVDVRRHLPTPRCAVPTRASEELRADPQLLRTVVERHRFDLGAFGRSGCAGAYAEVDVTGRLTVGERLLPEARNGGGDAQSAASARIAELVADMSSR